MRIEMTDIPRLKIEQDSQSRDKEPKASFFDTFKEAIASTNARAREADDAAVSLASGETGNIHETMIAMQKADIELRLLITTTNKLIEAYNQLNQLR